MRCLPCDSLLRLLLLLSLYLFVVDASLFIIITEVVVVAGGTAGYVTPTPSPLPFCSREGSHVIVDVYVFNSTGTQAFLKIWRRPVLLQTEVKKKKFREDLNYIWTSIHFLYYTITFFYFMIIILFVAYFFSYRDEMVSYNWRKRSGGVHGQYCGRKMVMSRKTAKGKLAERR